MAAKVIEGGLGGDAKMKIALVVARFNGFITSKLLEGALDCLKRHGVAEANCTVAHVPGAFEIPAVARRLAESGKFKAVLCLGCVIRGGTDHYRYVAGEVSKGVARLSYESSVPVLFGVLTVDTIEQAIERAGTKMGNKGAEVAAAALEMIDLYGKL